jgi:hypothetical protein
VHVRRGRDPRSARVEGGPLWPTRPRGPQPPPTRLSRRVTRRSASRSQRSERQRSTSFRAEAHVALQRPREVRSQGSGGAGGDSRVRGKRRFGCDGVATSRTATTPRSLPECTTRSTTSARRVTPSRRPSPLPAGTEPELEARLKPRISAPTRSESPAETPPRHQSARGARIGWHSPRAPRPRRYLDVKSRDVITRR